MSLVLDAMQVVAVRGCAYVVMVHRTDAVRALGGLKDLRLTGSHCKVCKCVPDDEEAFLTCMLCPC